MKSFSDINADKLLVTLNTMACSQTKSLASFHCAGLVAIRVRFHSISTMPVSCRDISLIKPRAAVSFESFGSFLLLHPIL